MSLRRGFSLIEVLVCCAVLTILSAIIIGIFWAAQTALFHGSAHVDVQQKARQAVRVLDSVLVTAMPPSGSQEAIYVPDVGASGTTLKFSTNQDLLVGGQTPDPRAATFRLYRVWFTNGDVMLDQQEPPTTTPPRLLIHGIQSINFVRSDASMVILTVTFSGQYQDDKRHIQTTSYSLETSIHLPYCTIR